MVLSFPEKDMKTKTRVRFGVFSTRLHQAQRGIFVRGLDGDRGDLWQAAQAAAADPSILTHPDTLQTVTWIDGQYGKDGEAILTAVYRRRGTTPDPCAGRNNFDMRAGREQIKWFSQSNSTGANGRPNGDIEIIQGKISPRNDLRVPVWYIQIRTILSTNPAITVGPAYHSDLLPSSNDAGITWGGFSIAQNTLRFDTALVQWRDNEFQIVYHFTLRGDPWEYEYWDHTVPGPVLGDMTIQKSFTSPGFPEGVC